MLPKDRKKNWYIVKIFQDTSAYSLLNRIIIRNYPADLVLIDIYVGHVQAQRYNFIIKKLSQIIIQHILCFPYGLSNTDHKCNGNGNFFLCSFLFKSEI